MRSPCRRGKTLACGDLEYALSMLGKHCAFRKDQRVSTLLRNSEKCLLESVGTSCLDSLQVYSKGTSFRFHVHWNRGVASIIRVNQSRHTRSLWQSFFHEFQPFSYDFTITQVHSCNIAAGMR